LKETRRCQRIYRGRGESSTERRKRRIKKKRKGDLVEGESIHTKFGHTL